MGLCFILKYQFHIAIILLLTLNACQQKVPDNFDAIVLNFEDSSVAPEYHRSYRIVIRENKVKCSINSYSTVLVDTMFNYRKEQFENLQKQITTVDDFGEFDKCTDCSGASHTQFKLLAGKKQAFSLNWTSAEKSKQFDAVLEQIKLSVPNFSQLLNTPLKDQ